MSLASQRRSTPLGESAAGLQSVDGRRLMAYALAAGATLAAAPEVAEATIVYTNPSDVTISSDGQSIDIDLNNDGIVDAVVNLFAFAFPTGEYGSYAYSSLSVSGNGQPTSVMGDSIYASALASGDSIDAGQTFQDIQGDSRLMAGAYAYFKQYPGEAGFGDKYVYGPFANTDGFLGLRFEIGGVTHFGWAHFNVFTDAGYYYGGTAYASNFATLTDFAYEACPNAGILAGQTSGGASCPSGVPVPPTLALVALGAGGLGLWRAARRKAA